MLFLPPSNRNTSRELPKCLSGIGKKRLHIIIIEIHERARREIKQGSSKTPLRKNNKLGCISHMDELEEASIIRIMLIMDNREEG